MEYDNLNDTQLALLDKQEQWIHANTAGSGRHTIMQWVGGSLAHGLITSGSDIDMRCIAGMDRRSLLMQEDMPSIHDADIDCTLYSLKKELALLLRGSQLTLEALDLPKCCVIMKSELADELIENRSRFYTIHAIRTCIRTAENSLDRQCARAYADNASKAAVIRHISKSYAEARRLLSLANLLMDDGIFPAHHPDDGFLSVLRHIRTGAYAITDDNAGMACIEDNMMNDARRMLHDTEEKMASCSLPENPTDDTIAWCDGILMDYNAGIINNLI